MESSRTPGFSRFSAILSTLLGPCGVWLYESGLIDIFGSTSLVNLLVVVTMALAGLLVGVYAVVRGLMWVGIANLVINSAVAGLYGFLALFFGLGGSR